MQEPKHTPLPLYYTPSIRINDVLGDYCGFDVSGADETHVCTCESEANAAFIVHACNNHYDLLDAAKLYLDAVSSGMAQKYIDNRAEELRAAIQKAEAE